MANFVVGAPIEQGDPVITVDAGLPPGVHRFQLVVVDDSGNESEPSILEVVVKDNDKPTAVLDFLNDQGQRVAPEAAAGQAFSLSGERSSDVAPGKLVRYRFTLLPRD